MEQSTICAIGWRNDGTVLGPLGGGLMGQYLDYWVLHYWNRALVVLLDGGLMGGGLWG